MPNPRLPSVDNLLPVMLRQLEELSLTDPLFIGIHTGGVWIAERLHQMTHCPEPLGSIDISFYRDDFSRVGLNPQVKASTLPVDIDARRLVLVDDVLHTGRTIRAALNEIFAYGRPASVTLAALVVRPPRELPIQADVCGYTLPISATEQIRLRQQHGQLKLDIVQVRPR